MVKFIRALFIATIVFLAPSCNSNSETKESKEYVKTENIESDIQQGITAYNNDKFQEAFHILTTNSDSKYFTSKAQLALGKLYEKGNGVQQDYSMAVFWIKKSASDENPSSEHALSRMYFQGHGVSKDYKKAFDLSLRAAHKDHKPAYNLLAAFYFNGYGVEKNFERARHWLEKSASQNNLDATHLLGKIYEDGEKGFVEKDNKQAIYWYKKAATLESIPSQNALGRIFLDKDLGVFNREEGIYWYNKSVIQDDEDAQYYLGIFYAFYYNNRNELDKGLDLLRKTSDKGYLASQRYLGKILKTKEYPHDFTESRKWLSMAAEQGDDEAQNMLGFMYFLGEGVAVDLDKAKILFQQSAAQGNAGAVENLDIMKKHNLY